MADKPRPTIIDYMAVAISPALIMLLVGSLTFFLLELMYSGEYSDRLRWILFWFVLAMVLISRIAMERGAGAAGMYGLLMAGAVGFAISRFVEQVYGAWVLLAVIWWCAHKLTWDCTLIDDSQDASGEGLLRVAGIEQQLAVNTATEPAAADPNQTGKKRSRLMAAIEAEESAAAAAAASAAQPVVKKKKSRAHVNWIERWLSGESAAKRTHTPGLWVVYFSLAALPLFGIGQLRIPATDTVARDYAFRLLMVYVAAAMGLLLTTSFLGLRRYLRQRNMEMSTGIAGNWLTIGSGLLITILFISLLLPRPAAQYSINGLVDTASEKLVAASAWAFPGGSGGTGDGADGGEPTDDGAAAEQSNDNQAAAAANPPGGNQNGEAPGDNRGEPGDAGKAGRPGGDQGDAKGTGQDPGLGQGENGEDQSGQNDGQNSDNNNNNENDNTGGEQDKSAENDSSQGKGQDAGKDPSKGDADKGDAGGKSGSGKSSSDQTPDGKDGGKNQSDAPKDGNDRAGETGKQREPGDEKQPGKQQQLQDQQRQDQQRLNQLRQRIAQKQRDKQRAGQQQPQNANAQVKRRPAAAQTPPKLTPQSINNSLPTGLQSLFKFLLWIVILAIILAVAWYCWPGMAAFFQQVWRELQQWWAWLTGQRKRPNQSAAAVDQIEEEPPTPFADFPNPFAGAGGKWTPGKLTAHTFEALQAWGREQGVERSADETPVEYADRLRAGLRECPAELMEFVQTYGRVAYARETPQRAQIDGMERLWRFMQRTADQNLARRTAVVSS